MDTNKSVYIEVNNEKV